jgi:hypothetical protein
MIGAIKPEEKSKLVNITDFCLSLLNNMYIIKGGKKLISMLLDPNTFSAFITVYNAETVP